MKFIDTNRGRINTIFVISVKHEKISDDKTLPYYERYQQVVTYLEGRSVVTAIARCGTSRNVEDSFETQIIAANPGFFAIDVYAVDDPYEVVVDKYPIIAWQIEEIFDSSLVTPICYHVDDSDGKAGSLPVMFPDGKVVVSMERIFPTLDEYRAFAIEKLTSNSSQKAGIPDHEATQSTAARDTSQSQS